MKVNLRKANRIQEELQASINKLEIQVNHAFDEHRKPEEVLLEKQSELAANVARKTALFEALYAIRKLTAKANADSGINDVLTDSALLEKKIGLLKAFENIQKAANLDVLESKIAAAKERKENAMFRSSHDMVEPVASNDMLEKFHEELKAAKRAKRQKQDELLSLNVKTEIELSSDIVVLLEQEGVV